MEKPVVRTPTTVGPELDALLGERDHLRVKISLAGEQTSDETVAIRRRILESDREITKQWGAMTGQGARQAIKRPIPFDGQVKA